MAPESMTSDPATSEPADGGRQIELVPVPPGFWLIIGGGATAAFGPLFGFLIGTMIGSDIDTGEVSPPFLALFAGILVGGLGVVCLLLGIRRLTAHRRHSKANDDAPEVEA